jgi:hypothetical protein
MARRSPFFVYFVSFVELKSKLPSEDGSPFDNLACLGTTMGASARWTGIVSI